MKRYQIIIAGSVLAAFAIAGTLVDQGQPGKQGAWPVSGAVTLGSAVVIDGGYINIYPTSTAIASETNVASLSANGTACTAVGGASCTIIIPSQLWVSYQNMTITLVNAGANTIDNVLVEWSPNDTNWELWDSTTFAGLPAGTTKSLALTGNSRRYLRVEARAAANTSFAARVDGTAQAF